MSDLTSYTTTSLPHVQRDGYMYWTYTDGTSAHPKFYRINTTKATKHDDEKSEPFSLIPPQAGTSSSIGNDTYELFFDPNTLSEKGEISVHSYSWSCSGRYFSYATSDSGCENIFTP